MGYYRAGEMFTKRMFRIAAVMPHLIGDDFTAYDYARIANVSVMTAHGDISALKAYDMVVSHEEFHRSNAFRGVFELLVYFDKYREMPMMKRYSDLKHQVYCIDNYNDKVGE